MVLTEQMGSMAQLVLKVHKVLLVRMVLMERMEYRDPLVLQVHKVPLDSMV
jgi:hypothetical protein